MLKKYVGRFRVLAEYDRETNDWIRDEFGNIDDSFDDFYIPFKNKHGRIEDFDDETLIINIWDLVEAKDIIERMKRDYHTNNLVKKGVVKKLVKTDAEILIYIDDSKLDNFLKYFELEKKGKSVEPFSKKNLEKSK